jgi:hypothetical protein
MRIGDAVLQLGRRAASGVEWPTVSVQGANDARLKAEERLKLATAGLTRLLDGQALGHDLVNSIAENSASVGEDGVARRA